MADQKRPRITQPVRLIYDVTSMEARALIGRANQAMAVLERVMALDGLDQLSYRVEPYPGALIICSKVFGSRQIRIMVGRKGRAAGEKGRECLCTCNFTTGYIFRVEPDNLDKLGADVTPLYTVLACVRGKTYRIFEHVLASDFTKYEVGQKIIMIPYHGMSFLCCDQVSRTGPSGCIPEASTLDLSDDDWRTTYRIIPWCGLRIPKWIKV